MSKSLENLVVSQIYSTIDWHKDESICSATPASQHYHHGLWTDELMDRWITDGWRMKRRSSASRGATKDRGDIILPLDASIYSNGLQWMYGWWEERRTPPPEATILINTLFHREYGPINHRISGWYCQLNARTPRWLLSSHPASQFSVKHGAWMRIGRAFHLDYGIAIGRQHPLQLLLCMSTINISGYQRPSTQLVTFLCHH